MKVLFSICMLFISLAATAAEGLKLAEKPSKQSVDLAAATIVYDPSDWRVVQIASQLLADDVERVTGARPQVNATGAAQVIVGTVGRSKLIDRLVKDGKIDVSAIEGGWERYVISCVEHPAAGVDRAVVVAGSDRRGTAYGVFALSELIGVAPWYWWADVPVPRKQRLCVSGRVVSEEPTVKYRGIFINDEDWGLKTWSSLNYEKELGDIGPKTYARVCELLLRLKGNMLAPAMHSCTGAFYSHADSKRVADEYGIMITTSHCEPLLFNNASTWEWDKRRDGEWNYKENKAAIVSKLDSRVKEASPFENIYTLAMRGLHDEGMRGNLSDTEKVEVLTNAINDQRDILKKYIDKPIEDIPQIFVPYKEALDIYELGLQVPEDVTLVWVDDNYGYIKRLSNPKEQTRKGRAGVYYHTSYLGTPHDYLWLNTTPPVLMYEELKKAYDTGADRYWLLNVGDIKPMELAISTFFEMAWSIGRFDYSNVNTYQSAYVSSLFGLEKYRKEVQTLLDDYYRLAWIRKPEYMGWEWEWDSPQHTPLQDTDFSFANYNDAQQRLADYKAISDKADKLLRKLPESYRAAFFEMIGYPVMAAYQMNRKFLMAQLNHELHKKGKAAEANWAAKESKAAFDSIQALCDRYNQQQGGKWNHFMAVPPGFCAKYQNMPDVVYTDGVEPMESTEWKVDAAKAKLDKCAVLNLADYKRKTGKGHTLRIIKGLGYDWQCVQLGEATEEYVAPTSAVAPRVDYEFAASGADNVEVTVYSLPFFPLHKGRSTRWGISIDDGPVSVSENLPKEWSAEWKEQVLQNGSVFKARFAIDPAKKRHKLSLICGDPGMIIQRVVIDWGGLKKTYVGPQAPKGK